MKKLLSLLTLSATGITIGSGVTNVVANQAIAYSIFQEKVDISGIEVKNPHTLSDTNATYGSLNKKPAIIIAVINAIYKAKQIYVYANDFYLTNDKDPNAMQELGAKVTFTVNASSTSKRISGSFTFVDTLSKNDISDISIADPKTTVMPGKTYGELNNNQDLLDAITEAIDEAKGIDISASDFDLTNDQVASANQIAGTEVEFTVTASEESDLIQGSFSFTDTLSKVDISNVQVADFHTEANPNSGYFELNSNQDIIKGVKEAINAAENTNISEEDFSLTNDQSGDQIPGTVVKFTVTASDDASQIQGSFTFIDTLGQVNISKVVVEDPETSFDSAKTYSDLNQNDQVVNAIINGVYESLGVVLVSDDIIITNDQDPNAKQKSGTVVTFTVTANEKSNQVVGSFTFKDTLVFSKADISNGITIADLHTQTNVNADYSELNSNQDILNAIISGINSAKGTTVSYSDFSLTNDQSGKQLPGTLVTFTVASSDDSEQITGSFTFIDTLAKVDISNGISINELKIAADDRFTFGELNQDPIIVNTVANAIYSAKGITVAENDITITNDQDPNAKEKAGTLVTFTVAAKENASHVTGSFTFTGSLVANKTDISNGINIADPATIADPSKSYASLNDSEEIQNLVIKSIDDAKGIEVTKADFTLSNDQVPSIVQQAGTVVTFTVTASAESALITGSFTFVDTLSKTNISAISIDDLRTKADSSQNYKSLNNHVEIVNAVIDAIYSQKNIKITYSDINITNDQNPMLIQLPGTLVTFTVTAVDTSELISGSFTFVDTLS